MPTEHSEGQIITFYSFKGGVGRTMALANVAFLLAMNGKRVLTMDWDLEAPGLAYYFRGLLDAQDAKTLKDSPGVLDILWDWSCSLASCETDNEIKNLVSRFQAGEPFSSCLRSLSSLEFLPDGASLDFIGSGGRFIHTPELKPYEEALAHFSWPSFFEQEAGGLVLDSLRNWAKSNYDIILIDSRTGLADVAGLCTMQIPDIVALCFVLNRQNIDGVAKIAAAIRTNRMEQVSLRALPMRVAREGTPEESDARARAISELTRIGGFSPEEVLEDFRLLSVKAADNVPFYETLAQFTAPDPTLDPLTFNYLRLGSQLTGHPLEVPSLSIETIDLVRRRLQPRNATVEYVTNLQSAEPNRATAELQRLVESAVDTELDGGQLDDDYVSALIEASSILSNSAEDPSRAIELHNKTLDLLRALSVGDPSKWKIALISAIEKTFEAPLFFLEPEEELALLEELDSLLITLSSIGARLKRLAYRRKAAATYISDSNIDAAMQTVGEIRALAKEITKDGSQLTPEQADEVIAGEADASLLSGDAYSQKSPSRAIKEYTAGLAKLLTTEAEGSRSELIRLRSEFHIRLALTSSKEISLTDSAEHAIQAIKFGINSFAVVLRFTKLAESVLRVTDRPDLAFEFCQSAKNGQDQRGHSYLGSYYGRQPKHAISLLEAFISLTQAIAALEPTSTASTLRFVAETSRNVLLNVARRRVTLGAKQLEQFTQRIADLLVALTDAGLPKNELLEFQNIAITFGSSRPRNDQATRIE